MTARQQKPETASFTPAIDKRIMEGFLGDREAMLEELSRAGLRQSDVLRRAAKLGLTKQFIQQCRIGGTDIAIRRCLGCDGTFVSIGPQNRLCQRCQARL